jgi:hypothetical protein
MLAQRATAELREYEVCDMGSVNNVVVGEKEQQQRSCFTSNA